MVRGRRVVALPRYLSATVIMLIVGTSLRIGRVVANVGTALYTRNDLTRTWTQQEAIRLHGRMLVDRLLPTRVPDNGTAFVEYLKLIADKSEIVENEQSRKHMMVMVADVLGGYMYGVFLVKVKASYYEGRASFDLMNTLYGIMRRIRFVLDTDGRGWSTPVDETNTTENGNESDDYGDGDNEYESDTVGEPCDAIYFARPSGGDGAEPTTMTVVPVPAFDDDWSPGSLAVPFAVGRRLYPVDAPGLMDDGDNGGRQRWQRPLLARYYRLAVACAASRGVAEWFVADFRDWLDRTVAPLLARPHRWYPVLAGASRMVRTVRGRTVAARYRNHRSGAPSVDAADDGLRACDDGPDGRMPNLNVFLSVVWLSLMFLWPCFGVWYVLRKAFM